jgi:superoxide dismutase
MAEAGAMVQSLVKKSTYFNNEILALQKKSEELEKARQELEKKESALAQERINLQRLEKDFQKRAQTLVNEMADFYPKTTTAVVTEINEKLKNEVDHLQAMLANSTIKEESPVSIDDITDTLKPATPQPPSREVKVQLDKEVKKAEKKQSEISKLFKKEEPEEVLFEVNEPTNETACLEVPETSHTETLAEVVLEPHADAPHHETEEISPEEALLEPKDTSSEDTIFDVNAAAAADERKEPKTTAIPEISNTEEEEVYLFDLEKKN